MLEPRFQLALTGLALAALSACGGSYQKDDRGGAPASPGVSSSGGSPDGGTGTGVNGGTGSAGQGVVPRGGASSAQGGSAGTTASAGSGSTRPPDSCFYNGMTYPMGASFPDQDGCNRCACDAGGGVSCTNLGCVISCAYGGVDYQPGQAFPSRDGCNQCQCLPDGSLSCSAAACACNPAREWWRKYYATSADTCALIDFGCPANTTGFGNACGCGCEEQNSCTEYVGCGPGSGCDETALRAACPYVILAE